MAPLAVSEVATGIWSFSASSTSSACAWEAITPPPATMIGLLRLASSIATASRTRSISGAGAERRHARELRLDQRLEIRLALDALAVRAAQAQVHRPRRARGRGAEHLAQQIGKARQVVDAQLSLVTASNWVKSSTSW